MTGRARNGSFLPLSWGTLALSLSALQTMLAAPPPNPPDRYDGYTITLLANGRWLAAGGHQASGNSAQADRADLYDPATGQWTRTGKLTTKRLYHAAALLSNGKVLVTGGWVGGDADDLVSAELYDPATAKWTQTGPMHEGRRGDTATLLADGRVLIAGGTTRLGVAYFSSAELYDPSTEKWTVTGPMNLRRVPRQPSGRTALTHPSRPSTPPGPHPDLAGTSP